MQFVQRDRQASGRVKMIIGYYMLRKAALFWRTPQHGASHPSSFRLANLTDLPLNNMGRKSCNDPATGTSHITVPS